MPICRVSGNGSHLAHRSQPIWMAHACSMVPVLTNQQSSLVFYQHLKPTETRWMATYISALDANILAH